MFFLILTLTFCVSKYLLYVIENFFHIKIIAKSIAKALQYFFPEKKIIKELQYIYLRNNGIAIAILLKIVINKPCACVIIACFA